MRKELLAGTAILAAACLAAGGALAADKKMKKPSISVNGYGDFVVGSVLDSDVDQNASAADVHVDSEIQFNGRTTLDSGIKLHMRVELETQSQKQGLKDGKLSGGRHHRRVLPVGRGLVRPDHPRRHRERGVQDDHQVRRLVGDRGRSEPQFRRDRVGGRRIRHWRRRFPKPACPRARATRRRSPTSARSSAGSRSARPTSHISATKTRMPVAT